MGKSVKNCVMRFKQSDGSFIEITPSIDEVEFNDMLTNIYGFNLVSHNIIYKASTEDFITQYVTIDNAVTEVDEGESFNANISITGFGLSMTVAMLGEDITDSVVAYNDVYSASINIPAVLGDVTIYINGDK